MKKRDVTELTNSILRYVDENGVVRHTSGSPVTSVLEMDYADRGEFYAHFTAIAQAQGNGSCTVEVKMGDEIVFYATGNFTVAAFNVRAEIYKPGEWQSRIPVWKQP